MASRRETGPVWPFLAVGGVAVGAVLLSNEDLKTWLAMKLRWQQRALAPGYPPICTSVSDAELLELQRLATGKTVVEFGSAYGYSTVGMALVAQHVTSVDPQSADTGAGAALAGFVAEYGVQDVVTLIPTTSQVYCQNGPPPADMVFIDGDHSFEGTLFDLRCAADLVGPTGVIACHDYLRLGTVRDAVDAFAVPSYTVDSMAVFLPAA